MVSKDHLFPNFHLIRSYIELKILVRTLRFYAKCNFLYNYFLE